MKVFTERRGYPETYVYTGKRGGFRLLDPEVKEVIWFYIGELFTKVQPFVIFHFRIISTPQEAFCAHGANYLEWSRPLQRPLNCG